MNRNFSSSGIILQSRVLGEKNRILDILTPDRGILRATAYGAASPRSRLRAPAQSFYAGEMQFYHDPVKGYTKLSDVEVSEDFPGLRADPRKLYAASLLAELLLIGSGNAEGGPEAYRLSYDYLKTLDSAADSAVSLLCSLALWRLLEVMGLQPDLNSDVVDGRALPEGTALGFLFDEGGFSRSLHGEQQLLLQPAELSYLRNQDRRSLEENARIGLPPGSVRRLFSLMVKIYEYNFQRRLKTLEAGLLP